MASQQFTKSDLVTEKDVEDGGLVTGRDVGDGGLEMRSKGKDSGSDADMEDMRRLGRTQQLNVSMIASSSLLDSATDTGQRNFRFISTLGFACTLMSTWEIELT